MRARRHRLAWPLATIIGVALVGLLGNPHKAMAASPNNGTLTFTATNTDGYATTAAGAFATPGADWTSRTTPADVRWSAIAYGNGTFVAVADAGTGDRVMTSRDGFTWTARTAPAGDWNAIAYGNGLFVALSGAVGTATARVITSPDGITWTSRTAGADNQWSAVTYGGGQFVAVAVSGTGNRVMTSPDGITWTSRASTADVTWRSVTYANGLYVAVGGAPPTTGERVMTSSDGITWTTQAAGVTFNNWYAVTYGAGLFVALSGNSPFGDQVMTSPDGITWTPRAAAFATRWRSLVYAEGQFVAVGLYEAGLPVVMTSPDGITWHTQTAAVDNDWRAIAYGDGVFVAVAISGTGNSVMTSGLMFPAVSSTPTATAGDRQATVSVTAGTDSGGPASSYAVTSSPGGRSCTITVPATSCVVTGLTNRTAYTFTATATNVTGTSGASPTSAAVTPRGPLVVHTRTTATAIVSTLTVAAPGTVVQSATRARLLTRAGGVSVCSTTKAVTKAGRVTLTCTLTRGAQAIRRRGALRVTLVTTLTLADGTTIASTKALVLPRVQAPKPKPNRPSAVTG